MNTKHHSIANKQDIHMFVSKLSVFKCNFGEDDGVYELEIKNSFGSKVCTVQVNINRNLIVL
jgi:hypothetical protein